MLAGQCRTLRSGYLADRIPTAYPCVVASDFTPEYVVALRRLSGEQKWRTAFELYWSARELKAAALREQHPEWTEEQVQERVKEIFLHAVS